MLFANYTGVAVVAAVWFVHYTDGDIFPDAVYPFLGLAVIAAMIVYVGKYIPTKNRHDSLLNKYGAIYLAEADRAISKIGMSKMLDSRWFEIYGIELCEKEVRLSS
jgi:hypothetical protein